MVHLIDCRSQNTVTNISLFCDILIDDDCENDHFEYERPIVNISCEANELVVATERKVRVFDVRAARSANGATWKSSTTPSRSCLTVNEGIECMTVSNGRVLLGTKTSGCLLWDSVKTKDLLDSDDRIVDENHAGEKEKFDPPVGYENKKLTLASSVLASFFQPNLWLSLYA